MKPSILVLGSVWSDDVREQVAQAFDCHFMKAIPQPGYAAFDAIASTIRGVLTTGTVGVTPALVAQLPRLEIVTVHGVGVDAVPLSLLAEKGIHVTNTPDVLTDDVADFAVLLLLSTVRRLPVLDRYVRAGDWLAKAPLASGASARRLPRACRASGCRSATTSAARVPRPRSAVRRFSRWHRRATCSCCACRAAPTRRA
jgi:lactate dehydrogenase-like 2-hydroxyacid dehydrogenase